jgi:hypothetical protein
MSSIEDLATKAKMAEVKELVAQKDAYEKEIKELTKFLNEEGNAFRNMETIFLLYFEYY